MSSTQISLHCEVSLSDKFSIILLFLVRRFGENYYNNFKENEKITSEISTIIKFYKTQIF